MSNTNSGQKPLKLVHFKDINALYKNINKDTNKDLYLSPKIKFKHLGSGWDAIQFICSWQRENNTASIILNKQISIKKLNFCDELLLTAFYLAEEVIIDGKDFRINLLEKFIPFVKNMNNPSLGSYLKHMRAREIKFLCLEGAKNEFLKLLYNSDKSLKSKRDIEILVGNILRTLISSPETRKYSHNIEAIKEIIYEAFSNADKHGYRDIDQHVISKNIRALSVNFSSFNVDNKPLFIKRQEHYRNFLRKVKNILVVSVFDSGVGIVKKYIETTTEEKEADLDFCERKKIFQKVFLPGITSSDIPNSGMGLTYIKDRVEELRGLLSIRTSSLELFFRPTEDEKYEEEIKEVSQCVGTLITVLIPIGFNKYDDA